MYMWVVLVADCAFLSLHGVGGVHNLICFKNFVQQEMELRISGKSWRKAKTAP